MPAPLSLRCVITLSALFSSTSATMAADAWVDGRVSAHDPTYFAVDPGWGRDDLNAKFQLSVALRGFTSPWEIAGSTPLNGTTTSGLYASFTQTSFWDLHSESKPFLDNNYRPELAWRQLLPGSWIGGTACEIDVGLYHESNGKAGPESRSLDAFCIRPVGKWMMSDRWYLEAAPRVIIPLGPQTDNSDIVRYRGIVDAIVSVGQTNGLDLRVRGRVGSEWDRGSAELTVSYPLDQLNASLGGRIMMQGFVGWSEYLATYNNNVNDPHVLIGWMISH